MNPDCDRVPPRPRHEDRLPTLRNGRRWLPWAGCCCLAVAGALWLSDSPLDDSRRLLLVVDPGSRHAAVYHVDTATGALVLRSTRNLTWDLMVDDFNAQEPRPAALKRMLQAGPAPTPEAVPALR